MITKKTWTEFRSTGLMLFVNQLLHVFGWALVFEMNEEKNIVGVYPARCKFRGFGDSEQDKAYKDVTEYMKQNAHQLGEEVNA